MGVRSREGSGRVRRQRGGALLSVGTFPAPPHALLPTHISLQKSHEILFGSSLKDITVRFNAYEKLFKYDVSKCTVNRISRDPLLARLRDFFAFRLATLSVPLPSPAEKLWPPYFLGRRGEGDGERCQPDSEEIPRPR